ncbi:MAG: RidA family protein [Proteobacteria bacterium]|nr:RidA family protein [Pseudomonadota bacterium]
MAGDIDARLAELGIELPQAPAPAANYVPFVVTGNLVFVAGQVTVWNGEIRFKGRLGDDMDVDEGYQAARLCGLNLIAQVKEAAGGDEAAQTEEKWADEDEVDDVGEGDDDGEDFEEMAESDSKEDENEGEEPA